MGFYNITSNNWIYQSDLGWIYLLDPSKIESVTWMWHQDIGWFWTGDLYAPDAYFNDFSSWFTFSAQKGSTALSWPIYYQVKEEWLIKMVLLINKMINFVRRYEMKLLNFLLVMTS